MLQQTIAAVATPPGKGGIAVIRLSGAESYTVAEKVFHPHNPQKRVADAKGYTALYGAYCYKGKEIDDGIALFFRAPHSYTGEEAIELSCHGGEEVSREILLACYEAGAVPAAAGEFTKRAVMNGRISLTQAEAVMDIIAADSHRAVAMAKTALSGALHQEIDAQKQVLLHLAGHLAAYIDYPEEDVEELQQEKFLATIAGVAQNLQRLLDGYEQGMILRRGVLTAIVGSPNVGKSTLFNLLSGFDRAIVTPVAGTTRDVVRESIHLGGVTLHLADTAGLRATQDVVESEGIRRSYDEMERAGLILAVFDGSLPLQAEDYDFARQCKGRPAIALINKSDLEGRVKTEELAPYFSEVVHVSLKDAGAKALVEEKVLKILQIFDFDTEAPLLANERQFTAVLKAQQALCDAQDALQSGLTLDAAGVCLDEALAALAALTGENASAMIIEDVFSRFCVGK